jgi:Co/Zn/Cd efflux system component
MNESSRLLLGIALESVGWLLDPRPVAFTEATVVAVAGLLVNIVSALLLSGDTRVTISRPATIIIMARTTAVAHTIMTATCAQRSGMSSPTP